MRAFVLIVLLVGPISAVCQVPGDPAAEPPETKAATAAAPPESLGPPTPGTPDNGEQPNPPVVPSSMIDAQPAVQPGTYVPITADQRAQWVLETIVSPKALTAGILNAGIQTCRNVPDEWGPHWGGFGRRLGTRQATLMISNSIEATVGSIWGEDPRYYMSPKKGFWPRFSWAVTSGFMNYRRDGTRDLALARMIALVSTRAITNTWRPPSDQGWARTTAQPLGTGIGFRFTSNIFREFWPDIRKKIGGGRK